MAKRFIDTELFSDEWFCELSKDTKLFFLYFITSCDHAGVLKHNKKLCEFQTGIKTWETVFKELGNCLVTLKDGVYWMPKFIKFQYPKFPQSNVKQQGSAISILANYGINIEDFNSYLTLSKESLDSYVNDNDNVLLGSHLFKNSPIFDKLVFKNTFSDWSVAKLKHYYDSAVDYSESKGKKYKDWAAAIRSWERKDKQQGKTNFELPRNNAPKGLV